jgi:hypothetical protein
MFPFRIRFQTKFSSESFVISDQTILDSLKEELKRTGVDEISITDKSTLEFKNLLIHDFISLRPGLNWNIWVGISYGKFIINTISNSRGITYEFDTYRILTFGLIFALLVGLGSKSFTEGLFVFGFLGVLPWFISVLRHRFNFPNLIDSILKSYKQIKS